MLKYFVRTTGKRNLHSSYSQIKYELLIDNEGNCANAFLKQLCYINEYDSILLEDDLILCKEFKSKVEKVIEKHPNDIINFFTYPDKWINEGYSWFFAYNQCTYFPKGTPKRVLDAYNSHATVTNSAERIMQIALKQLHLKHYIYRPCLVQHLDNGSLMGHDRKDKRRSPYFIDYLDELGITYEDARLEGNKENLMNLMNEKFKELDKNKNQ